MRKLANRSDGLFDTIMIATIVGLAIAMVLVVARGDQVGQGGVSKLARSAPSRIVYLWSADGITQNLYTIDPLAPDKPQQLTNADNGVISFDVLPDGSKIIYTEVVRAELPNWGTTRFFIWDAETRQSSLVYECQEAACNDLRWRPDGGAVALERVNMNPGGSADYSPPRVWVLDMAQKAAGPLFKDNQQLSRMPRWSPDGKRLAVTSATAGGIIIHDFTSGKDSVIATTSDEIGSFSPDGKWLTYPRIVTLDSAAYAVRQTLVDLSSNLFKPHDLVPTSESISDVQAVWQADSKGLIVARQPPNRKPTQGPQLFSVDLATGAATLLLPDNTYSLTDLSLSPSGDMILFQRTRLDQSNVRPEIALVNLRMHTVTLLIQNGSSPRWLP